MKWRMSLLWFSVSLLAMSIGLIKDVCAKSQVHISLLNDISRGNVFVTYYSPQCQFSQHFLELWKKINAINLLPTIGGRFTSHMINCKEEIDLCVEHQVKYYPSLRFHHVSSGQPLVYHGARTAKRVLSFLSKAMLGSHEMLRAGSPGAESPPETAGGVMQLTDQNFESAIAGDPVFVKFYTDWCPHCKQIEPVFPQLARDAKQLGVALGAVNCESQGSDTCSKQSVPHYPMLALFASGRKLAVFDGENSVPDWLQFLGLQLGRWRVARAAAMTEGIVPNWYQVVTPVSLTWGSFDDAAKATEFLFVKFFAPWCAHCQRLAPVWERLAHDLAQEFPGRLAVARADCTEEASLCTQHGIRGYPSLLLFRWGRLVDSYRGLRDLSALTTFARAAVALHGKFMDEL